MEEGEKIFLRRKAMLDEREIKLLRTSSQASEMLNKEKELSKLGSVRCSRHLQTQERRVFT